MPPADTVAAPEPYAGRGPATALDNVAFGLRMRKVGAARRKKRAAELLDMVGLSAPARQRPHQLAGGQQQRVALARAPAPPAIPGPGRVSSGPGEAGQGGAEPGGAGQRGDCACGS